MACPIRKDASQAPVGCSCHATSYRGSQVVIRLSDGRDAAAAAGRPALQVVVIGAAQAVVQQGRFCDGGGLAPACPAHACRGNGDAGIGEAALVWRMLVCACQLEDVVPHRLGGSVWQAMACTHLPLQTGGGRRHPPAARCPARRRAAHKTHRSWSCAAPRPLAELWMPGRATGPGLHTGGGTQEAISAG